MLSLDRRTDAVFGEVSRDEFMRSVAHELNGLLLTISSGASVVAGAPLVERQRLGAEIIDTAAKQARLMLRGLTRIARDKSGAEPRTVELCALVHEIAAVGRAFVPSGTRLRVTTPAHAVWARVDEGAIEEHLIRRLSASAELSAGEHVVEVSLVEKRRGRACIRVRAVPSDPTPNEPGQRLPRPVIRASRAGAIELTTSDPAHDE